MNTKGHVVVIGKRVGAGCFELTGAGRPTRIVPTTRVTAHVRDLLERGRGEKVLADFEGDDATFVRRAFLDVCGRLPTPAEVQTFVDDAATDKRDRLIDRLLESSEYADFFAAKWNAVLRNRRQDDNFKRGSIALHAWIRESLYHNKPFDQFVGELLASSGEATSNPPVVWYRQVRESHEQVEDAAQLFLGMRLQCARCHHHPFEKWSQQDYYGLAAFFSRVGRKPGSRPGEERIVHQRGEASATHPKTGKPIKPAPLDGAPLELTSDDDPRQALADWLAQPDNPFFAPALVNRYWKHFFGRALVEPEDDMRVTNPPTNPALLDALARSFIESGYDAKKLARTICLSNVYRLSAIPNAQNADDQRGARGDHDPSLPPSKNARRAKARQHSNHQAGQHCHMAGALPNTYTW